MHDVEGPCPGVDVGDLRETDLLVPSPRVDAQEHQCVSSYAVEVRGIHGQSPLEDRLVGLVGHRGLAPAALILRSELRIAVETRLHDVVAAELAQLVQSIDLMRHVGGAVMLRVLP